MRQSQLIFKNVLAGGICTALGGVLQIAAVLLIARNLSVREFGLYSFIATLAFVLYRVSDMGVSAILMRDLAVEPSKTITLLSAALSLAWLVVIAYIILSLGIVMLAPFDRRTVLLGASMGLSGVMQFPCGCYGAVLRAREENELDGIGFLLHKVFLLSLICLTLWNRGALAGVVCTYIICAILQCLYYRWIVIKRVARPRFRLDVASWRYLLSNSLPFGLAGTVRLLGEQADVTILAWFANFSAVGFYSGAYKITVGLRFIPEAMVVALLPIYSRAASGLQPGQKFHDLYERSLRVSLVFGFAVVVFFVAAPQTLITGLLGPRYAPAAEALRLLAFVSGVLFVACPFPYLLMSLGEQRFLLVSSIVATGLRVILNLALTPLLGFRGPCYALMISESLLLCLWVGRLAALGFRLAFPKMLWRPALAGCAMLLILYCSDARSLRSLVPLELAATFFYLGFIVKLRAFSTIELQLFREGLGFMKPFVTEWSRQLRPKT